MYKNFDLEKPERMENPSNYEKKKNNQGLCQWLHQN